MYDAVVAFPAMRVGVRASRAAVEEIVYLACDAPVTCANSALAQRAARQLERYRDDADFEFDLPLAERGTPFQRSVWQVMRAIPRGETLTYGAVARRLGSAARAVGQACAANRLPLLIPCHRVVGSRGVGGFAHHAEGFHVEVKRWLLQHERAI